MLSETDPVLTASGLSKRYATYRSNLVRFASWFGVDVTPAAEFWPIRDLSFTVGRGEAVAIIGQNGAGKSTLLKLITGTVRPTQGAIHTAGRVNAILELGLGFNPEFTGRENVFYAGGLMGLSPERLKELLPDIEAFAEIGEFFEQPLRSYSSGMQARLAFAVVTAERPDILIIDEVLAVGDSYFQHKCFDRIRSFKEAGSSILIVTHSITDVRALCDRVILIDKGKMLMDGPPDQVVDYYNALIAAKENEKPTVEQRRTEGGWSYTRSGSGDIIVENLALVDAATQKPVSTATVGQELEVITIARARADIPQLVMGQGFSDRTGRMVWGTNTWHTQQLISDVKAGSCVEFRLRLPCNFAPGSYSISTSLVSNDTHLENNYDWQDNMLVFDVINSSKHYFTGLIYLPAAFSIHKDDK